jgi:uncharacterized protein YciI
MTTATWLLLSRYVRPLDEVDAVRAEHVAHLGRQRDAGRFVAWGRLVPPTGGFVLARNMDRDTVDGVLAEDPFSVAGVAEWEVRELSVTGGVAELVAMLSGGGSGV